MHMYFSGKEIHENIAKSETQLYLSEQLRKTAPKKKETNKSKRHRGPNSVEIAL